jgi:signal transduction histidine kinase
VQGDALLLDISEEIELYHILQEALNNAMKHAQAASVEILLSVAPGTIELNINDDGIGFDVNAVRTGGMGLTSMAERAKRIGGILSILSEPGKGTQIRFIKG